MNATNQFGTWGQLDPIAGLAFTEPTYQSKFKKPGDEMIFVNSRLPLQKTLVFWTSLTSALAAPKTQVFEGVF